MSQECQSVQCPHHSFVRSTSLTHCSWLLCSLVFEGFVEMSCFALGTRSSPLPDEEEILSLAAKEEEAQETFKEESLTYTSHLNTDYRSAQDNF